MPTTEEIKTAIVDRENDLKRKFQEERIIEREIAGEAGRLISKDVALVITGPRRCGKSILAFMLGGNRNFGYVNFDDERLTMEAAELNKVLEALYSLKGDVDFLILDEIQNIPGWEKFVSRIVLAKKVILTGSNAKLLSAELATHLTGRHVDIVLFPFGFREFLSLKGLKYDIHSTPDVARIRGHFEEYLEIGGFPLAQKLGRVFLAETYRDILEKDLIQRYKIKYPAVFKELAKYLVSNASNEVSFNRMKNMLGVKSPHTVRNYASYLSGAYLVFLTERFSFKLKEQALAPKKAYCIDNGLVNTIGFKVSENRGKAMENLAAIELFRAASRNRKLEVYYWKDHQQREVDFLLKEGKTIIQLIQVTNISSKMELDSREIDSLLRASRELGCDNLLVLTYAYEAEERIDAKKVRFVPLWKWLLTNRLNRQVSSKPAPRA